MYCWLELFKMMQYIYFGAGYSYYFCSCPPLNPASATSHFHIIFHPVIT